MIMGCDTEKELADVVDALLPDDTHVRGTDGSFTIGNTYTFSGEKDPRAGNPAIGPGDGVSVDYKVYDTRAGGGK
jgi:hypothetical protein